MDILSGLNSQQRQAVTHQGTPLLVLAGAGSGKTRVLTHRAAYLVNQQLAKPSEILLLTFTNKAAGEMKSRMSKLITDHDSPVTDHCFAGTFHSFCCSILRRHGSYIGIPHNFVIYDTDDQQNTISLILKDLGYTPKEFKPSSVLYFIESAKNSFLSPEEVAQSSHGFWAETAAKIYKIYQKKLSQFQALDFNDLIFRTIELFYQSPEILDRYQDQYRYLLIDEYQDTNQTQYLLTKLLSLKYRQITVVGDASQAIYGWRGADYRNLDSFVKDFSDTTTVNLEENYRSTQIILDAANQVISQNSTHPILKLYTTKKSSDPIKLFEAGSEIDEAEYVAQKIQFLVNTLHLPTRLIAVLYRMNSQSRVIEEAFLKYNIPYVLVGGLRFYDRAEIKDVLAMVRYTVNRSDQISYGRLIKTFGKRKLANFEDHLSRFQPADLTSIQILESLVVNSGYLDRFDPKDEDDQHRIDNIKELKSVATSYPNIHDFLENIALVQAEYSQQEKSKKKENRDGVRLMTLHSSKGLEFEAVFLVGFEEGILPHSRSMVQDSDIEEERRLAYVGITRAKDYLFVTYATRRLQFGRSSLNEPSRFLADISSNLVEFDQPNHLVRNYRASRHSDDDSLLYDPDIY